MNRRTMARGALLLVGLVGVAPQASALSYGEQSVASGGQTAYGKGSTAIVVDIAKNNAQVKVAVLNGKGGYTDAFFSSPANSAQSRSGDSQSTSYKDVSHNSYYSGPTYGPWTAKVHTCIDVPWQGDPCSGWSSGAA